MKIKIIALSTVCALGLAGCAMDNAFGPKAKISKTQAEKTALAKVHHGKVKSSELEKEHGKLVWSVDITKHGTKNITEVQVDAMTGKVVGVETETPEQEAKEHAKKH